MSKKTKMEGKRMYGQSVREMPESTDAKKVQTWLRKGDLKTQLESLVGITRTGSSNKETNKKGQT